MQNLKIASGACLAGDAQLCEMSDVEVKDKAEDFEKNSGYDEFVRGK